MAKKRAKKMDSPHDMDLPKGASEGRLAGPDMYTVAKCQWCGMHWKHFGAETPDHFCGKMCASHIEVEPDPSSSDG